MSIKNAGAINLSQLKEIEKRIKAFSEKSVVIGVPASEAARNGKADPGANNATIAAAHEFGVAGRLPERSFLRSTMRENGAGYAKRLAEQIDKSLSTNTQPEVTYAQMGMQITNDVKRKIIAGINPPLSDVTKEQRRKGKERKATSVPLYDTGQLIQSIHYEIRDG
jgi:hypothetical protein